MINKVFYLLIGLSISFSVMYISQPSLAQGENLSKIFINGLCVEDVEGTKWLKEKSSIVIKGSDEKIKIKLIVCPESGLINVEDSDDFPPLILVDNSYHENSNIQLPYKIKRYRVSLRKENISSEKLALLHLKLGYKLTLDATDLLIIPFIYDVAIKVPCRYLFSKKCTIKICIAD